jgi:AcrR family transcriptional regulator
MAVSKARLAPAHRAPSHRDRKKRRKREKILANAVALFRKTGIRGTRTLRIAEASEISPATLFNYFSTKDDLAEAWVRGEVRDRLEEVARGVGDAGLRAGLRSCCRELAVASCSERELRIEAWRTAGRAAGESFGPLEALERVVGREQERGRIRADLPASAFARMLEEAVEGGLISGLAESGDPKQVAAILRARVDLILDGARKRNERVSAPRS